MKAAFLLISVPLIAAAFVALRISSVYAQTQWTRVASFLIQFNGVQPSNFGGITGISFGGFEVLNKTLIIYGTGRLNVGIVSRDGGKTWTTVTNSAYMAGTPMGYGVFESAFWAWSGGSILTSSDGASWAQASSPCATGPIMLASSVTSLFAVCPAANSSGAVFRSDNEGTTWSQIGTLPALAGIVRAVASDSSLFLLHLNGGNVTSVKINPFVVNSTSWPSALNAAGTEKGQTVCVSNGRVYAIWTQGLLVSTNDGNSWATLNLLYSPIYPQLLACNGSNVAIGYMDSSNSLHVSISQDNGASWSSPDAGLPPNRYSGAWAGLKIDNGSVYAMTFEGVYAYSLVQ